MNMKAIKFAGVMGLVLAAFTAGAYMFGGDGGVAAVTDTSANESPIAAPLARETNLPTVQPATSTGERHGDWLVRCVVRQGLPPCEIVQSLTDNQSRTAVMQFSVSYSPAMDIYALQIQIPLGFVLSAGTVTRIDEMTDLTTYEVTRCEPQGCFIEKLIPAADLAPFETGTGGAVVMITTAGQPVGLPFSLNGFEIALNDMVEKNRRAATAVTP